MENILLIFLTVLVIWAVAPVIGRWIRRRLLEHFIKRMTGGAASPFGAFGTTESGSSPFSDLFREAQQARRQQADEYQTGLRRRRTREFMRQVSETVRFEELPPDDSAPSPRQRTSVRMESQISDVEWEEL